MIATSTPDGGGNEDEAYVSATQQEAPPHPRLPRPHEDPRWSCGHRPPSSSRPQAALGQHCQQAALSSQRRRLAGVDQRFPRLLRLLRRADFVRIQRGRGFDASCLRVRVERRDDGGPPRFGLTVSKRVGNAVTRNRVKRWLREAIRRERGDLDSVDVVFIARPSAASAGYVAILRQVRRSLRRIQETG